MKLAIIGATGLVGKVLLQLINERDFPYKKLILAASEKSQGKYIVNKNQKIKIVSIEKCLELKPDIVIFSAGADVSRLWAEKFALIGSRVIDNSSAWRNEINIPLVIPEVNGDKISREDMIIANPNCSTIQMVLVLSRLHEKYKIKRIVISTYQSVTGSGQKAIQQLMDERTGNSIHKIYPHKIDLNLIPQGGNFCKNGYSTEEMKLLHETQKILDDSNIKLTATVVRVPVTGGHSEAVNVEFKNNFDLNSAIKIISSTPGVIIEDDPFNNIYPMPFSAKNKDNVYVGRIRRDYSTENALNLWIVADNLRKGAATNAIQIAELLIQKKYLSLQT